MKRAALVAAALLLLAACAHQPGPLAPDAPGLLVGFFHGFIAIISLIGSIFLDVRIYAFPNDGFWYDLGFVIGFCTNLLVITLSVMARIGGMIT